VITAVIAVESSSTGTTKFRRRSVHTSPTTTAAPASTMPTQVKTSLVGVSIR
jgi:hypothetical protein